MDYCIVDENGIIENMIVCNNDAIAHELGALPSYEGAGIGKNYTPPVEWLYDEEAGEFYREEPPEPTQLDRVEAQATYTAMMTDTLLEV